MQSQTSVSAGAAPLNFSTNNELLIINLALVVGSRKLISQHKACYVRNPKMKFRSPSSDCTFKAKPLTAYRSLQYFCKAYKTQRSKPPFQKSCNRQHTVNGL
jgi:hypothetical protein